MLFLNNISNRYIKSIQSEEKTTKNVTNYSIVIKEINDFLLIIHLWNKNTLSGGIGKRDKKYAKP